MRPLTPDFFVVGAMKCGTTSLHHNLARVPGICMTKVKEPNIMLRDNGLQGYERLFSRSECMKGEVSPRYTQSHAFPGVAGRIHKANPSAKIIFIVRDPLERMISHIHHDLFRDRLRHADIGDVLARPGNPYLLTSSYWLQMRDYVALFGKEKLLVLNFDATIRSPYADFDRLLRFLVVEKTGHPFEPFYQSEKRYFIWRHDFVHQHIRNRRILKAYHLIWYLVNRRVSKPELSRERLSEAKALLAPDIAQFAKEFNFDTSSWKLYNQF